MRLLVNVVGSPPQVSCPHPCLFELCRAVATPMYFPNYEYLMQELGLNSEVAVVFNVEEHKAVITGTW